MTFSLFQIHSTKHCKLCSWEIFLLVNLSERGASVVVRCDWFTEYIGPRLGKAW